MCRISSAATSRKRQAQLAGRLPQAGLVGLDLGGGQQPHAGQIAAGQRQGFANGGHDRGGGRAAAAAHADDQVLDGLGGRRDHRFGVEDVGHVHRQLIGAAFMPAEQAHGPSPAHVDGHDCWIDRLVPDARGDGADDCADGSDIDQPVVYGKYLPRQFREAVETPACGSSVTPECRKTSHASHDAASFAAMRDPSLLRLMAARFMGRAARAL